jgi:hypothetical protein
MRVRGSLIHTAKVHVDFCDTLSVALFFVFKGLRGNLLGMV